MTTYTWDSKNRMILAETPTPETVTFTFNADHQRVKKETSAGLREFIYDERHLLRETKTDGTTMLYDVALTDEYGEINSRYHDEAANNDYYLFDGLGNNLTGLFLFRGSETMPVLWIT